MKTAIEKMPCEPTEAMIWAAREIDPALTFEHIRSLWSSMWCAYLRSAQTAEAVEMDSRQEKEMRALAMRQIGEAEGLSKSDGPFILDVDGTIYIMFDEICLRSSNDDIASIMTFKWRGLVCYADRTELNLQIPRGETLSIAGINGFTRIKYMPPDIREKLTGEMLAARDERLRAIERQPDPVERAKTESFITRWFRALVGGEK